MNGLYEAVAGAESVKRLEDNVTAESYLTLSLCAIPLDVLLNDLDFILDLIYVLSAIDPHISSTMPSKRGLETR